MNAPRERQSRVSRRGFLRIGAGGALAGVALPMLQACAPNPAVAPAASSSSPSTAATAGAGGAASSRTSLLPSYVPFSGGPKADFHDDSPLYSDAYDNYPKNPVQAAQSPPGSGGVVNVLVAAYFPSPTPVDLNPTWQAVNKALNADVRMNIIPGADYRAKFATTMSGDDLPDIMHIFFGYSVAPNLPGFFKAKCADLAPYLAGDAAKDYPYLAAIPTPAWKNSIAAVEGALYLIPIHRQMTSVPPYGGNFFKNVDMWDAELGQNYVPANDDEFTRALKQLNRPQENRWALGNFGTNNTLFGLNGYAEMFNAPNNWKLDGSGKPLKDRETEEYKAAVGYLRDLMQAGLFPSDAPSWVRSRDDFVAKKFAVSVEGQGNSWVDFWQRGLQQNPPTRFGMIAPFAAQSGQKPVHFLGTGFISMNALKKASPDRIRELLRIMNYLAAPFGSQEDLLLSYGLKDQDYTVDANGNPKTTADGVARAGYVPWRYIAQHPWVYYQSDLPGFAKASHEAEQATLPIGVDDPTNGFYAPTQYGKGASADMAFNDGVREIILGRTPMSAYDGLVKDWVSSAGDQIRKEYRDAMAAGR
jgi:putative aldouronate transport system substrate-binding protein